MKLSEFFFSFLFVKHEFMCATQSNLPEHVYENSNPVFRTTFYHFFSMNCLRIIKTTMRDTRESRCLMSYQFPRFWTRGGSQVWKSCLSFGNFLDNCRASAQEHCSAWDKGCMGANTIRRRSRMRAEHDESVYKLTFLQNLRQLAAFFMGMKFTRFWIYPMNKWSHAIFKLNHETVVWMWSTLL